MPAPIRLLSIRARTSGDAADFLPASALFGHHPTLRSTGEEDARCAEPTSATQTKTCTRTSRVPDSLRSFRCVDVPRRIRLRTTFGDSKVSRPSRSLRRTVLCALFPRALIPHGLEFRAWALSSHGAQAIEPLTPLSQSIVHPQRLAELPRRCLLLCLGHTSAFLRVGVDRGMREPPRPSPSPTRESLRRVLIRDAFHQ
jgi:hypothetical protein